MKEFLRNFRKQKVVGILNICSLSLGIMVAVTVGLWALNELSFDDFHEDVSSMYRVAIEGELNGVFQRGTAITRPFGPAAADMIPQIGKMTRVVVLENEGIRVDNMVYFDNRILVTDNNFFDFFTFPLKYGDAVTAFAGPDNIVITEKSATRYFPDTDPMGQTVRLHGKDFTVTGVMHDFPRNSHLQADMVVPFFGWFAVYGWNEYSAYDTYFVIGEGADLPAIEKQLAELHNSHSVTLGRLGPKVVLEPVRDIHFSPTSFDMALKGDKRMLVTFIIIAVLILVISCINFSNLFVSTTFIRARSIGIRKSQGASKSGLALGFYKETLYYVLIAVVIGVLLAVLGLPVFNGYAGSSLSIDFTSPVMYVLLAVIVLVTVVLAGSFPALYMTRLGVIETLQGRFRSKRMSLLQRGLVVFQFSASLFLLLTVMFFSRQINFLITQDLGFDKENVISVKGWGDFGADFRSLREELLREPSIRDISMRQYSLPFDLGEGANVWTAESPEPAWFALEMIVPNYFDFFGVKFTAGENPFWLESSLAMRYCVLNEAGAEALGLADPVGQVVYMETGNTVERRGGNDFIVRGVVKDTHFFSLHKAVDPQIFVDVTRDRDNPIFFRIAGDPTQAIRIIERKWKEMEPHVTFEYKILGAEYEKLYNTEKSARSVLLYALVITLIITVAGLFATAFYSAQRRTREIAIRKVNGATSGEMLVLLNREILWWVVIAFVIAAPAAWIFMGDWLSGFATRISLDWYVFLAAGLAACFIAMITVSFQSWKAASANPVDSLKANN